MRALPGYGMQKISDTAAIKSGWCTLMSMHGLHL